MSSDLKCCPVCGSSQTIILHTDLDVRVECMKCHITHPSMDTLEEAINKWNKLHGIARDTNE